MVQPLPPTLIPAPPPPPPPPVAPPAYAPAPPAYVPDAGLAGLRARLARDVRPGDVVVVAYPASSAMARAIATLSNGPWHHTLICVAGAPNPRFIEAWGPTGRPGDPRADVVRHVTFEEAFGRAAAARIVRPAEALPPAAREAAIRRAIAYAERQVGKPYDYAFTNADEGPAGAAAYYCSELALKAWTSPQGAGLPGLAGKDARRDGLVRGIEAVVNALQPYDRPRAVATATRPMFAGATDPVSLGLLIVDGLLPAFRATAPIVADAARRDQLRSDLMRWLGEGGLPSWSLVRAFGSWTALKAAFTALRAALPHAEAFAATAWPDAPVKARAVTWAVAAARFVGGTPAAAPRTYDDLTSPTDIAMAPAWRQDYPLAAG